MALKKGDILDEFKRHQQSCGLVVKVMGGGAGFEKIVCCGHDLTEEDLASDVEIIRGRKRGPCRLPSFSMKRSYILIRAAFG